MQPSTDRAAEWPLRGRRLLALFPHPDDEAYAAGGTIARATRDGASVWIASATRGEAGRPGGVGAAAIRARELEESCRALGTAPPIFLDLEDGAIESCDRGAAEAKLATLIEEIRPQVVITLGRDGAYASRDHQAWTAIVDAALAPHARRGLRLLHSAFPKHLFLPVWRSLGRRPGPRLTADLPPTGLGCDPEQADLSIDIQSVREAKLAAVAAHRSQLVRGDPFSFLWPGLLAALLDVERWLLAAGPPLPAGARHPFSGL